jgi:hypothetical protein
MRSSTYKPPEADTSHQKDARRCLNAKVVWREHETKFLNDMLVRKNKLTEKQAAWLSALVDKAIVKGGAK